MDPDSCASDTNLVILNDFYYICKQTRNHKNNQSYEFTIKKMLHG